MLGLRLRAVLDGPMPFPIRAAKTLLLPCGQLAVDKTGCSHSVPCELLEYRIIRSVGSAR